MRAGGLEVAHASSAGFRLSLVNSALLRTKILAEPIVQITTRREACAVVTQDWGNPTDANSSQFNDPNFKRHNGIDANVGRSGDIAYRTQFPIYCPVEGFRVESVSYEANGGGNQISLVSIDPLLIGNKLCYARVWLCHGKKVLVKEKYHPKLGEVIMIGNNTGFSIGPHTHIGLYRLDGYGDKIDRNDATGSIDPALFSSSRRSTRSTWRACRCSSPTACASRSTT